MDPFPSANLSRRRLLKTLFCSSVAMKLNLAASASPEISAGDNSLEFLAIGDFGSGSANQSAVARGMAAYAKQLGRPTDGMFLLGDNFYGPMPGGLESPRWQSGFSQMYPAEDFPGKCWAILGNHDYHDTPGNELVQLGYAASLTRATRWTMPGKYYRLDLPARNPLATFLMIDTNWPGASTAEDHAAQEAWLKHQLSSPRAPFTVVAGHHPVYSDGSHGDTKRLVRQLAPLLEEHAVHLYLCGHDHDLQHLELEGLKTSFVISGGGGAALRPHEKSREGAYAHVVHGFSHLSFTKDRMHLRHIDAAGKIVHAFSKGVKHDWKIEV
jgi:tartrate-resistant acid phosphatase type 5